MSRIKQYVENKKGKVNILKEKTVRTLKNEGPVAFAKKSTNYAFDKAKRTIFRSKYRTLKEYKDILIINGCGLNHPKRYRCDHQMEQLVANNITCDIKDVGTVTLEDLKYYSGFIIFRCPIIDSIKEFIEVGKKYNKPFFYDIDDLVFDEEAVMTIDYIKNMNEQDFAVYIDGVRRNDQLMKLCQYGITTTPTLREAMLERMDEVFINRNVASEKMLKISNAAINFREKDESKVRIGYLSGSITHNPDFEMIKEPLLKLLKEHSEVTLVLAGLIDLPEEFKELSEQVEILPFTSWEELPYTIANLDINLAPIEDTRFNRAKSENKWTEASLVKVATIASKVGAFEEVGRHKEDIYLVDNSSDSWYTGLKSLIEERALRENIAKKAHLRVTTDHITTYSGKNLADYVMSKLQNTLAFVTPTTNISGGMNVVFKHAEILIRNGYNVTVFSQASGSDNVKVGDTEVFVISNTESKLKGYFNKLVGTLWSTMDFVSSYGKADRKLYLVQNYETNFYVDGRPEKLIANSTYSFRNVEFITISKWCQDWLRERFNTVSKYAPNGLDLNNFSSENRDFNGKIRVLIEGNSADHYKNVDESFRIANMLDKDKFEVTYLSYGEGPKDWYVFDKFYSKIPYAEVGKIYKECDLLIKSSLVESFSYPPLEMMGTGGLVVVAPNGGNAEYLVDGENCLLYEQGNLEDGFAKVNELVKSVELRQKLIENGLKTAQSRDWKVIEDSIKELYR